MSLFSNLTILVSVLVVIVTAWFTLRSKWRVYNICDDFVYYLDGKVMYVSVHLTNDVTKFKNQVIQLANFIHEYPNHTIVVMGDWNAVVHDNVHKTGLIFLSKDDGTIQCKIDFGRLTSAGILDGATTCKKRILTAQGKKILDQAQSSIDNCFVVYPQGSIFNNISTKTEIKIFDKIVERNVLAPVNYPSDHYAVTRVINLMNSETHHSLTWNVLGESVGVNALNWGEFLPADINLQSNIREIMNEVINDQPDIDGKKFGDLLNNKGISSKTRYSRICNIHPVPEIPENYQTLSVKKFMKEINDELAKESGELNKESQDVQVCARALVNFWNDLYNHKDLKEFFINWFILVAERPKITFDKVLDGYLKKGDLNVIALQEVSKPMISVLVALVSNHPSYKLIYDKNATTKTRGALIVHV